MSDTGISDKENTGRKKACIGGGVMREKNYNLELIRIVSFLLVIVVHATNFYCRAYGKISGMEYAFSLSADIVARICVPCFFMISGALLMGREEPVKKSIMRAWHYFYILIIWSVFYFVMNRYVIGAKTSGRIWESFAEDHLWYLYALIPICLCLPFLQLLTNHMTKKMETALLIVGTAFVLLRFLRVSTYLEVPIFGWHPHYIYFFYLGYYMNKYKDRIPLKRWHLATIFIVANLANMVYGVYNSVVEDRFFKQCLSYISPFVILCSAVFFLFVLKFQVDFTEKAKKRIDMICGCSFGVYLCHIVFLNVYMKLVPAKSLTAFVAIPLIVVLITSLAFVTTWLLRKTWVGRKLM